MELTSGGNCSSQDCGQLQVLSCCFPVNPFIFFFFFPLLHPLSLSFSINAMRTPIYLVSIVINMLMLDTQLKRKNIFPKIFTLTQHCTLEVYCILMVYCVNVNIFIKLLIRAQCKNLKEH